MTCWSVVREVTRLQEVDDRIIALYIFYAFPSLGKPARKTSEKTYT
jgi:hypothetical protein